MESTGLKQAATSRVSGLLASLDLIAKASAQLLHPSSDLKNILPTILEMAQSLIAADAYAVWRACADGSWDILASAGLSEPYRAHRITTPASAIPHDTVAIPDVFKHGLVEARRQMYLAEEISSLLIAPLLSSGEVIGTLTFYFRGRHASPEDEIHLATALANLTAAALSTSGLHQKQTRIQQQSEFLAEASAVLASSMDYEATLSAVTQLAVPHVADWCAIDLYDRGELHRVGVAHRDPGKVDLAREYRKHYPPDLRSDNGVGAVVRTGQPQFFPHVTEEMKLAYPKDARHREILDELGIQSFLITPLKVRDRVLGALTLVCAHRDMDFADCRLADQLAQRAAIAIENAGLF
ncbi:MAG: GAF domain-containing protein, partial [Sciscionella sp.]